MNYNDCGIVITLSESLLPRRKGLEPKIAEFGRGKLRKILSHWPLAGFLKEIHNESA
jgi:hypothetical protein